MINKNKISNRRDGFTLVETLFSTFILSMVLIGIITILIQAVDISNRIDYEYTAFNIAKDRLELARTVVHTEGFDALSGLSETSTMVNEAGDLDAAGDYERTTAVTESYSSDDRRTKVAVGIYYYYRGNKKTSVPVTMTTVFCNIF